MAVLRLDGIGTDWEIETDLPLASELERCVLTLIERYDVTWSRFRSDSLIARVAAAQNGGVFPFPAEAPALLGLYDALHEATEGAVDPLVGCDLERLGYDAAYSLIPVSTSREGPRRTWPHSVVRHGAMIVTQGPVLIDVGAAGKGQLIDLVAGLLREAGIAAFLIDAGGGMAHVGAAPIAVGLEHPDDPSRVIGVAQLQGRALCASAGNRRAWGEGLHHIIDARTGTPASAIIATWAIADDAMTADGLATALFFADPARLQDIAPFEWVRMTAEGIVEASASFCGELYP